MNEKIFISVQITVKRERFGYKPSSETEMEIVIAENAITSLDLGNVVENQLIVALQDLKAQEAETEKEKSND